MSVDLRDDVPASDSGIHVSSEEATTKSDLPDYEFKRLLFHVGFTGIVALFSIWLTDAYIQRYIILVAMVALILSEVLHNHGINLKEIGRPSRMDDFARKMGQREREIQGDRYASGDVGVGLVLSWIVLLGYHPMLFTSVIFISALADPFGRLVGVFYQRNRLAVHWPDGLSGKTVQGSLAVMFAASLGATPALGFTPWTLVVGAVVMVVEMLPRLGGFNDPLYRFGKRLGFTKKVAGLDDNLSMPIAASVVLLLLAS